MENNRVTGQVRKNIYMKLQEARVKLQESNLKKTGENKFAGFKYFELGDFLPTINKIFDELSLCSFINFSDKTAVLTIINSEEPTEKVEFSCPVVEVTLKGANAIQNLGAMQTYLRRYLYMNCLEIVENDEFDAVIGKGDKLTDKQINRMFAIAKKAGITKDQVILTIRKDFKCALEELTKGQYDEVCERLEKKAEVK